MDNDVHSEPSSNDSDLPLEEWLESLVVIFENRRMLVQKLRRLFELAPESEGWQSLQRDIQSQFNGMSRTNKEFALQALEEEGERGRSLAALLTSIQGIGNTQRVEIAGALQMYETPTDSPKPPPPPPAPPPDDENENQDGNEDENEVERPNSFNGKSDDKIVEEIQSLHIPASEDTLTEDEAYKLCVDALELLQSSLPESAKLEKGENAQNLLQFITILLKKEVYQLDMNQAKKRELNDVKKCPICISDEADFKEHLVMCHAANLNVDSKIQQKTCAVVRKIPMPKQLVAISLINHIFQTLANSGKLSITGKAIQAGVARRGKEQNATDMSTVGRNISVEAANVFSGEKLLPSVTQWVEKYQITDVSEVELLLKTNPSLFIHAFMELAPLLHETKPKSIEDVTGRLLCLCWAISFKSVKEEKRTKGIYVVSRSVNLDDVKPLSGYIYQQLQDGNLEWPGEYNGKTDAELLAELENLDVQRTPDNISREKSLENASSAWNLLRTSFPADARNAENAEKAIEGVRYHLAHLSDLDISDAGIMQEVDFTKPTNCPCYVTAESDGKVDQIFGQNLKICISGEVVFQPPIGKKDAVIFRALDGIPTEVLAAAMVSGVNVVNFQRNPSSYTTTGNDDQQEAKRKIRSRMLAAEAMQTLSENRFYPAVAKAAQKYGVQDNDEAMELMTSSPSAMIRIFMDIAPELNSKKPTIPEDCLHRLLLIQWAFAFESNASGSLEKGEYHFPTLRVPGSSDATKLAMYIFQELENGNLKWPNEYNGKTDEEILAEMKELEVTPTPDDLSEEVAFQQIVSSVEFLKSKFPTATDDITNKPTNDPDDVIRLLSKRANMKHMSAIKDTTEYQDKTMSPIMTIPLKQAGLGLDVLTQSQIKITSGGISQIFASIHTRRLSLPREILAMLAIGKVHLNLFCRNTPELETEHPPQAMEQSLRLEANRHSLHAAEVISDRTLYSTVEKMVQTYEMQGDSITEITTKKPSIALKIFAAIAPKLCKEKPQTVEDVMERLQLILWACSYESVSAGSLKAKTVKGVSCTLLEKKDIAQLAAYIFQELENGNMKWPEEKEDTGVTPEQNAMQQLLHGGLETFLSAVPQYSGDASKVFHPEYLLGRLRDRTVGRSYSTLPNGENVALAPASEHNPRIQYGIWHPNDQRCTREKHYFVSFANPRPETKNLAINVKPTKISERWALIDAIDAASHVYDVNTLEDVRHAIGRSYESKPPESQDADHLRDQGIRQVLSKLAAAQLQFDGKFWDAILVTEKGFDVATDILGNLHMEEVVRVLCNAIETVEKELEDSPPLSLEECMTRAHVIYDAVMLPEIGFNPDEEYHDVSRLREYYLETMDYLSDSKWTTLQQVAEAYWERVQKREENLLAPERIERLSIDYLGAALTELAEHDKLVEGDGRQQHAKGTYADFRKVAAQSITENECGDAFSNLIQDMVREAEQQTAAFLRNVKKRPERELPHPMAVNKHPDAYARAAQYTNDWKTSVSDFLVEIAESVSTTVLTPEKLESIPEGRVREVVLTGCIAMANVVKTMVEEYEKKKDLDLARSSHDKYANSMYVSLLNHIANASIDTTKLLDNGLLPLREMASGIQPQLTPDGAVKINSSSGFNDIPPEDVDRLAIGVVRSISALRSNATMLLRRHQLRHTTDVLAAKYPDREGRRAFDLNTLNPQINAVSYMHRDNGQWMGTRILSEHKRASLHAPGEYEWNDIPYYTSMTTALGDVRMAGTGLILNQRNGNREIVGTTGTRFNSVIQPHHDTEVQDGIWQKLDTIIDDAYLQSLLCADDVPDDFHVINDHGVYYLLGEQASIATYATDPERIESAETLLGEWGTQDVQRSNWALYRLPTLEERVETDGIEYLSKVIKTRVSDTHAAEQIMAAETNGDLGQHITKALSGISVVKQDVLENKKISSPAKTTEIQTVIVRAIQPIMSVATEFYAEREDNDNLRLLMQTCMMTLDNLAATIAKAANRYEPNTERADATFTHIKESMRYAFIRSSQQSGLCDEKLLEGIEAAMNNYPDGVGIIQKDRYVQHTGEEPDLLETMYDALREEFPINSSQYANILLREMLIEPVCSSYTYLDGQGRQFEIDTRDGIQCNLRNSGRQSKISMNSNGTIRHSEAGPFTPETSDTDGKKHCEAMRGLIANLYNNMKLNLIMQTRALFVDPEMLATVQVLEDENGLYITGEKSAIEQAAEKMKVIPHDGAETIAIRTRFGLEDEDATEYASFAVTPISEALKALALTGERRMKKHVLSVDDVVPESQLRIQVPTGKLSIDSAPKLQLALAPLLKPEHETCVVFQGRVIQLDSCEGNMDVLNEIIQHAETGFVIVQFKDERGVVRQLYLTNQKHKGAHYFMQRHEYERFRPDDLLHPEKRTNFGVELRWEDPGQFAKLVDRCVAGNVFHLPRVVHDNLSEMITKQRHLLEPLFAAIAEHTANEKRPNLQSHELEPRDIRQLHSGDLALRCGETILKNLRINSGIHIENGPSNAIVNTFVFEVIMKVLYDRRAEYRGLNRVLFGAPGNAAIPKQSRDAADIDELIQALDIEIPT